MADGALEAFVDQIISFYEGSQNTAFRYCSREHLIFPCVVIHKVVHSDPKCSKGLFIF